MAPVRVPPCETVAFFTAIDISAGIFIIATCVRLNDFSSGGTAHGEPQLRVRSVCSDNAMSKVSTRFRCRTLSEMTEFSALCPGTRSASGQFRRASTSQTGNSGASLTDEWIGRLPTTTLSDRQVTFAAGVDVAVGWAAQHGSGSPRLPSSDADALGQRKAASRFRRISPHRACSIRLRHFDTYAEDRHPCDEMKIIASPLHETEVLGSPLATYRPVAASEMSFLKPSELLLRTAGGRMKPDDLGIARLPEPATMSNQVVGAVVLSRSDFRIRARSARISSRSPPARRERPLRRPTKALLAASTSNHCQRRAHSKRRGTIPCACFCDLTAKPAAWSRQTGYLHPTHVDAPCQPTCRLARNETQRRSLLVYWCRTTSSPRAVPNKLHISGKIHSRLIECQPSKEPLDAAQPALLRRAYAGVVLIRVLA